MHICVVGAGAIGGLLAAKLAESGQNVRVVARGEHLKAIRERGLTLKEEAARPSRGSSRQIASPGPDALIWSFSGSRRISSRRSRPTWRGSFRRLRWC